MIRSQQRGLFPFPFVFSFDFSFLSSFGTQIGCFWAATTTPILSHFPFYLFFIRSDFVRVGLAGGFEWFEPSTDSLSFVGTSVPFQWTSRSSTAVDVWWASSLGTSFNSRFYWLPYLWVRSFKTLLFEEPPPHPNCIASLVMANSIRPFSDLLGWDQGSKPSAVLDIGCCGCSCNLLDFGQALCRLVLLLLLLLWYCCCNFCY